MYLFKCMCVCLQARLQEFKAAGHDVDLEFMEESLIALQGKSWVCGILAW